MTLPFIKMHGLGNDFVVFDHIKSSHKITPKMAAMLADRRMGVGCDQVIQLLAPPSNRPTIHAEMRIYNGDGSQAEMCGNAARCVAKYLRQTMNLPTQTLTLQTLAG
ncbi:MAG: diaminopimelate epimerase, partial [Magnetococcales bacterium]|nr:diaminopimelate epimerase [Magnetococcales bacterium]